MRIRYTYIIHIVLILLYYFTRSDEMYEHFLMHGDALYLPHIYRDIIVHGHPLQAWHSTPSIYAFPDITVFFLLRLVIWDFRWALLIFCTLQYLCMVWLMDRCARLALRHYSSYHAAMGSLFFGLYMLAGLVDDNMYESHQLLNSAAHTGSFINTLICLLLVLQYFRRRRFWLLPLLLVVIVLAVVSDRLFITMFLLPAATASLLYTVLRRNWRDLFIPALLALGAVAGIFLLDWVEQHLLQVPVALRSNISRRESFAIMLRHYIVFTRPFRIIGWIGILSALVYICIPVRFLQAWRQREPLEAFTWFFLLAAVGSILLVPPYTAMYRGADCFRYTQFAFHLLLFFLPFALGRLVPASGWKSMGAAASVILLFIIIQVGIGQKVWEGARRFQRYKPFVAEWVDQHADVLHRGVAEYWTAKQITLFSDNGIEVVSVRSDLVPYAHEWSAVPYLDPRGFDFIFGLQPTDYSGPAADSLMFREEPVYLLQQPLRYCSPKPGAAAFCPQP